MVRRKTKPEPPPKVWTLKDIDKGIEKLRRRINDVQSLLTDQVRFDDARKKSVESNIAATIEDVFGTGSREHRENSYISISKGPHFRAGFHESQAVIDHRSQQSFVTGIPDTIAKIEGLVNRLEEKKKDFRRCPRCNLTFENISFCTMDGTPLVDLSYNPDAETLPMSGTQSIEQRLTRLTELKDKGLISVQDFESRKEKILDEI